MSTVLYNSRSFVAYLLQCSSTTFKCQISRTMIQRMHCSIEVWNFLQNSLKRKIWKEITSFSISELRIEDRIMGITKIFFQLPLCFRKVMLQLFSLTFSFRKLFHWCVYRFYCCVRRFFIVLIESEWITEGGRLWQKTWRWKRLFNEMNETDRETRNGHRIWFSTGFQHYKRYPYLRSMPYIHRFTIRIYLTA